MQPLRQQPHEDIEPHGERALQAERRANGDQGDVQPDTEIFGADEAGGEDITQRDIGQNDGEQHGQQRRGRVAETGLDDFERPCRKATDRDRRLRESGRGSDGHRLILVADI